MKMNFNIKVLWSGLVATSLVTGLSFARDRKPQNEAASKVSSVKDAKESKDEEPGLISKIFEFHPPSLEAIAAKLGYTDVEVAKKEGKIFFERVQAGYLPNTWAERCKSGEYSVGLCVEMEDYFGPKMSSGASPKSRRVHIALTPKNAAKLQHEDFQGLINAMPKWNLKTMKALGDAGLKQSGCPRNLSLALAVSVERLLSDSKAYDQMSLWLAHGIECITPKDPHSELILLRAALFKIAKSQNADALPLLERALESESHREEPRVLYWAWKMARELGKPDLTAKYYERMITAFPSAWHSILAQTQMGDDPMKFFDENKPYPDTDISGDPVFDRRFLWLQLMLKLDLPTQKLVRYGEFVESSLPLKGPPGSIQYFSRVAESATLYRLQILALSSLLQERPRAFTRISMKLLYPRPYLEDFIAQTSGEVDLAVLFALARQESSFNIGAISGANARGLFQVLPSTARSVNRQAQLSNHVHNIQVGAKYFQQLAKMFEGSVEKSLASYNAGPGSMRQWESRYGFVAFSNSEPQLFVDLIPYRETRDYVSAILRNAYWYHRLYPEFGDSLRPETYTSELLQRALKK